MIFVAAESRVDMRGIVHSFCVPRHEILQSIHWEARLKRYGNEADGAHFKAEFKEEDKTHDINMINRAALCEIILAQSKIVSGV